MAFVYSYALGTSNPPTNLETLLIDSKFPRGLVPKGYYAPASVFVDRLDGHISGHGAAQATWTFDILTAAQVAILRTICPGYSANVFLTTRIDDNSFDTFSGIMIWPAAELMKKRNFGGRYLGLEFIFRQLEAV
jgi:hypothetical protein